MAQKGLWNLFREKLLRDRGALLKEKGDVIGEYIAQQHLEEGKSLKMEVEELESLLGPDDSDVDYKRILEEVKDAKGCAIRDLQVRWSERILGGQ